MVVAPPGRETGLALLRPQDVGAPEGAIAEHSGVSLIADDTRATYEELRSRGVEFTAPPERMPWGAMGTWFKDQDGTTFFLSEEPK